MAGPLVIINEHDNGIYCVKLNRPKKLNALSIEMREAQVQIRANGQQRDQVGLQGRNGAIREGIVPGEIIETRWVNLP